MFDKLGRLVASHPVWILLGWIAAAVLLAVGAPPWAERCQDDDIRFLPARCLSVQGYQLLQKAFPQEVFCSKVIFAFEREDEPLTADDLVLADQVAAELEAVHGSCPHLPIRTITSKRDALIGSRLLSEDRQCTLVIASLESPFLAFRTVETVNCLESRIAPLLAAHQARDPGASMFHVATTGPAGIGRDINAAAYSSLEYTTAATFLLVVVILLLVYRAPLLALVPLLTIGGSVWMSLRILSLLSLMPEFQLVNITRIFVVVVLYGAGTDYCLFLISRYREELQQGRDSGEAIRFSLRRIGGALTASAGTVVCGLGMMGFAEFAKIRCTGPALALSLVVALLASLTLAPALLRLLGDRAFWPRRGVERSATISLHGSATPFWQWVSCKVAAYPFRIWLASVLLLLPLAWLGMRTQNHYDITAELPRATPSRYGMEIIRRHFIAGEIGPLSVLLQERTDWNSPDGRAFIAKLSRGLSDLPNVAEVRSLTQPLGAPTEPPRAADNSEKLGSPRKPGIMGGLSKLTGFVVDQVARSHYLAKLPEGNVTRLDVIFHTEPFSPESVESMKTVQAYLDQLISQQDAAARPSYALYGMTPITNDIAYIHESDRSLVNVLTLASILLILIAVVRRPFVALYLLVSVLFSYYATIGATELLSVGWMDSDVGRIDWKVPFFLFTILVAVGEDYNIFLMARVLEESRRHGPRLGTQRALACTGGTITSCGLIMAGTFATMMLCSLSALAQLGLALAFGVLLDTFVVRPILVPAFLLMLHRQKPGVETMPKEDPVIPRQAA